MTCLLRSSSLSRPLRPFQCVSFPLSLESGAGLGKVLLPLQVRSLFCRSPRPRPAIGLMRASSTTLFQAPQANYLTACPMNTLASLSVNDNEVTVTGSNSMSFDVNERG